MTRRRQAKKVLDELKTLDFTDAVSSPDSSLSSLKVCLKTFINHQNDDEIDCKLNMQKQLRILDGALPDWASNANFDDADSCDSQESEGLPLPTDTQVKFRSFQVLEY